MALENQPVFQAPSIPKMGKKTVSSSIFSSVKSAITPKLNVSKFSFSSPLQKLKTAEELKVEKISVESQKDIAVSLNETNRILVEIQKQLSIDFANRITERKQNLVDAKNKVRKTKLTEKEEFVERGISKETPQILNSKVFSPIRSIFDKVLEFLSLLATGIIINNAWNWLSKKENREKLIKIFQFLREYWDEILKVIVGIKLLKALGTLIIFASRLRRIFNALKGLRGRRPPGSSGPAGRPNGNGGGTPPDCGPITKKGGCLDQLSPASEVANNLARTLFATAFAANYFNKFALKTVTNPLQAPVPQTPEPARVSPASYGPLISEGIKKALAENRSQSIPMPDGGRVFINNRGKVESVKSGEEVKRGEEQSRFFSNIFTGLNAPAILRSLFSRGGLGQRTTMGTNVLPSAPQVGTLPGFGRVGPSLTQAPQIVKPASGKPRKQYSTDDITWKIRILQKAKKIMNDPKIYNPMDREGTRNRLIKIYTNPNSGLENQAAARNILLRKEKNGGFGFSEKDLPQAVEGFNPVSGVFSKINTGMELTLQDKEILKSAGYAGTFSTGGVVPGRGSGKVDSVPAMLAPGEFVINALSTKLFKPFLHFVNDNAGKVFSDLVQSINSWKQNTLREDKVTQTSDILFRELSDQIRELKDREVKKAQDELLGKKNPTNDNNDPLEPPQDPNNPQPQIIQQPKPRRQNLRGGRTRIIPASGGTGGGTSNMVVPTKKEVPHKIQTYRRGKGGGTDHSKDKGKVTTINLTKPAIDLASKKTPDSPPTQPTQSSSPSIVINPIDMSNSYNLEFFSMYEIV